MTMNCNECGVAMTHIFTWHETKNTDIELSQCLKCKRVDVRVQVYSP